MTMSIQASNIHSTSFSLGDEAPVFLLLLQPSDFLFSDPTTEYFLQEVYIYEK